MQAALDNSLTRSLEIPPAAVLCLRNIGKSYGAVQVLAQINVDIRLVRCWPCSVRTARASRRYRRSLPAWFNLSLGEP